jgi:hypothetical protein
MSDQNKAIPDSEADRVSGGMATHPLPVDPPRRIPTHPGGPVMDPIPEPPTHPE